MKALSKKHFLPLVALLLAWTVLIACSFLSLPGSSTKPAATPAPGKAPGGPAAITPAANAPGQAAPADEAVEIDTRPDPLDRLIAMRSIKINLTTRRPDGSIQVLDVEIDPAGSLHAAYSVPPMSPTWLPKGFDPKQLPTSREVFAIGGKVYQPNPQNPDWKDAPLQADYAQTLAEELHSPDGPALYLDLLAEGSIQAAGKDNVGGFAADKYQVNGQAAGQPISGTIWFEPRADALVQAELSVPGALYGSPGGQLKITLKAQKASISPLKLPDIPMAAPLPKSTP